MNPDFSQNDRDRLEAKLTTFLLGELPPDETVELCKAMDRDPELAKLYERLKRTVEFVRESAVEPASETAAPSAPLKLSDERRQKLIAQFKTITPKEFIRKQPIIDRLVPWAIAAAAAILIGAITVPNFIRSRDVARKNVVLNNLRLLDGAKQQWALETGALSTAVPTMQELKVYLGRGDSDPMPPVMGETYLPGKVSDSPVAELSPGQARRMFSARDLAKADKRDGKVELSADGLTDSSLAQNNAEPKPKSAPVATDAGVNLAWVSDSQPKIAPSESNQVLSGYMTTNAWLFGAGSPADNKFVARYGYIALPPGQSLDVNGIQSQAGKQVPPDFAPTIIADNENIPSAGQLLLPRGSTRGFFDDGENAKAGTTTTLAFANGGSVRNEDLGRDRKYSGEVAAGGGAGSIDRLPVAKPAPPETVKSEFAQVDANDNRALGFNWYFSTQQGVGSGGPVTTTNPQWIGLLGDNPATNSTENVATFNPVTRAPVISPPAPASDQIASYNAAKEALDSEKRIQSVLAMRTTQEEVDKNLPRQRMVTITDRAEASKSEQPSFGEKLRETFSGKVERTARITVEQEHPDISGLGTGPVGNNYDPYFLQTEFQAIQSHEVLSKAVAALNLNEEWGKKYNHGQPLSEADTEALLKGNLDLDTVRNTKFIEIGARSKDPEEAAKIANAVAEAYRQYRSDEYEELKNHGIVSLQQQLTNEDKKVKLAQAKVDELRSTLGINDAMANASSPESLMTADRLRQLSVLRVQKEADYNQEKALLEKLKPMDREQLGKTLPSAVGDNQLSSLLQELDLAEQNLTSLKRNWSPDSPKYQNAKDLVDDLNRKINEREDGILLGLESRVTSSAAYLETLNADIKNAEKADIEYAQKSAPYFAAKEKLEAEKRQQAVLLAKAQQNATNSQADAAFPKPVLPPPTPQPEILTRENAFSTFSLNVSDVSFKLAAASLEKGQMPEPASIRSEEFINAFDYRDPEAAPGVPIAFTAERAAYPFEHHRELLRFSLKTAAAGRQAGRPLNIVLLLDNSGSMERADRVRIIQEALRVLAGQLQAQDTFSIVTFARTARLRVDGIRGNQAAAAVEEIAKLTPEGGTNLGEALDLAYQTALHHYLANGDNRVVMLTDGAANLGEVDANMLKQKVEAHRKQGVALDCFGIGWEGYNDDLLEVLTRNGDGRYGFINTPEEAKTGFAAQIAGALHVAAADVKVQVEFNPQRVISDRQIGYGKHQLTKEQFRDNTVDAAEIAAQEAGNALYTIEINPQGEGSIGTVRVRYKVPGTSEYREQAWDVPYTGNSVALESASPAMRLAATASAFSEWLATSPFAAEVSPDKLLRYLNGVPQVYGADTRPAKLEWMIRQAKSISGR